MEWQTIEKPRRGWVVMPNLADYEQTQAAFSWETARRALDGLPGGRGLNIAHEAVDRHAAGLRRNHLALRWLGKRGEVRDFTEPMQPVGEAKTKCYPPIRATLGNGVEWDISAFLSLKL